MTTSIDMEAEVRRLAAEYPDAVYQSFTKPDGTSRCFYDRGEVTNGPPELGCIMGQAALNVAPDFWDNELQHGTEEVSIGELVDFWDNADFLTFVQDNQDKGNTWSAAVAAADKTVAEINEEGDWV